jgi:hypothetical protein
MNKNIFTNEIKYIDIDVFNEQILDFLDYFQINRWSKEKIMELR